MSIICWSWNIIYYKILQFTKIHAKILSTKIRFENNFIICIFFYYWVFISDLLCIYILRRYLKDTVFNIVFFILLIDWFYGNTNQHKILSATREMRISFSLRLIARSTFLYLFLRVSWSSISRIYINFSLFSPTSTCAIYFIRFTPVQTVA